MLDAITAPYPTLHAALRSAEMPLSALPSGTTARVLAVESIDSPDIARRLSELGFLPGETVRIVARGLLPRAPIAVRIGTATFALRLFEAGCVRVRPEQPQLP